MVKLQQENEKYKQQVGVFEAASKLTSRLDAPSVPTAEAFRNTSLCIPL